MWSVTASRSAPCVLSVLRRASPAFAGRVGTLRAMSTGGSSIWEAVSRHAESKSTALVAPHQDDGILTYRELMANASSFAGNLTSGLGYKAGDRLAMVLGGNCKELLVLQLGAAFAGVTVVTAENPRDEKLVGCRGLVVSDHMLVNAEKPNNILKDEKHPPIVCHDDVGIGAANVSLFYQAMIDQRPIAVPHTDGSSLHAIYGSGTSLVAQADLVAQAHLFAMSLKLTGDDTLGIFHTVPLSSSMGFGGAVATLSVGGTLVIPGTADHQEFIESLDEEGGTAFLADHSMMKAMEEGKLYLESGREIRGYAVQ